MLNIFHLVMKQVYCLLSAVNIIHEISPFVKKVLSHLKESYIIFISSSSVPLWCWVMVTFKSLRPCFYIYRVGEHAVYVFFLRLMRVFTGLQRRFQGTAAG
jgi:hypothetical protein